MDNTNAASPASSSSSASDSDAFNTESARVYFGPLKTPERNFVASTQRLFPPVESSPLRRSPRLSSPRPEPPPIFFSDRDTATEETEDIELVAQLVNEVEVDDDEDDEDELSNSQSGTPQKGGRMPDEPSSALADRILHAIDNPSPPPSPPPTMSIFDPYHTTTPDASADYQTDLLSLRLGERPQREDEDENPLLVASTSQLATSLFPSAPSIDATMGDSTAQPDLISFDSFSSSPKPLNTHNDPASEIEPSVPSQTMSIDQMLSQSPTVSDSPPPIPIVVIEVADGDALPSEDPMSIDSPKDALPEKALSSNLELPKNQEQQPPRPRELQSDSPATVVDESPPLRRSSRPRRSVTPNPSPFAPAPVFTAPAPSPARTLVRKKIINRAQDDEIVSDSQDEDEDLRRSPARVAPAPTRVRARSPGKSPMSFHRELGSLSPTSANVLSSLAFTPNEAPNSIPSSSTSQMPSSAEPPAMFSFSVFTPALEAAGAPSTPVRSKGPVRLASPPKSQTSPNKFRLQPTALDDPTRTPARRIPIEEGVAQGHVSPEKAVQMGFRANGTPLPSTMNTPARRVLVTDKHPPTTITLAGLRFGSPAKPSVTQKERSADPGYRVLSSLKGKEKATPAAMGASSSVVKPLPYPIVAAAAGTSTAGPSTQENLARSQSSPAKSNLKQATSRIPRIGAKPYARMADVKAPEKAKTPTTIRAVDLTRTSKPAAAASTASSRRSVRAPDSAKPTASSTSRSKPAVSTSTTVLKRKREAEKSSPVKPRVIMLRQVPIVAPAPANEPSTSSQPPAPMAAPAKGKRPAQRTLRRVVSPDPPPAAKQPSPPVQSANSPLSEPMSEEPTIVYNPRPAKALEPEPMSSDPPSEPSELVDHELPPGSPMKQDTTNALHREASQPILPPQEPMTAPLIVITAPPSTSIVEGSASSGLRRTTRSRRGVTTDVVSEGSSRTTTSRRKAASSYQSDGVFSGMSMTALKDLTTSNTVHNQKYLAARLETEVIRKDGLRPESPAVKIRTITQRQQEEQDKNRTERAKRRARRSDEMATSDMEASSDVGYSSPAEEERDELDDDMETLPKHQRGAGEDDDYESPERPFKNMRARLFDDGPSLEKAEETSSRRVKWDRGLFTLVYLDEVKLGSRQTLKENRSLKGILAPTAKALRLDTLGNLPQAEAPLADLVPENVTVKKFVYDNDVVAVPEIAVVKNTRSKKRK